MLLLTGIRIPNAVGCRTGINTFLCQSSYNRIRCGALQPIIRFPNCLRFNGTFNNPNIKKQKDDTSKTLKDEFASYGKGKAETKAENDPKSESNDVKNDIKSTNSSDNKSTTSNKSKSFDIDFDIKNLPSAIEARKAVFRKKIETTMDKLQATLFMAGKTLNDVTGYSSIEKLKNSIDLQEQRLKDIRQQVRDAKESYTNAIATRANSQREVNELLQRKHNWSPEDLERFTTLYRNDHGNELAESQAEQRLNDIEHQEDDAQTLLTRNILARYHEEQIWSDKIRRASTWGTWTLMAINIMLFIIVQLGLEPWKRRRLVGSFEDKVHNALDKERQSLPEMLDILKRLEEKQTILQESSFLKAGNLVESEELEPESTDSTLESESVQVVEPIEPAEKTISDDAISMVEETINANLSSTNSNDIETKITPTDINTDIKMQIQSNDSPAESKSRLGIRSAFIKAWNNKTQWRKELTELKEDVTEIVNADVYEIEPTDLVIFTGGSLILGVALGSMIMSLAR